MRIFFNGLYVFLFNSSLFILFLSSLNANALGLSTYRIYLDDEHNQQNFVVYNRDSFHQDCQIAKRHFIYDEYGKMSEYEGKNLPKIAADDLFRYSPRKFRLESGAVQTVRFKLRRKKHQEPLEYRTYISVDCKEDKNSKNSKDSQVKGNLHLIPRLRHNVPVVVRTGKLDAKLFFDDVVVKNKSVMFSFNKDGNRSTYGDIVLINKNNDKVIGKLPSVSLPLEKKMMNSSFFMGDVSIDDLVLSFIEDKELSGEQVIEFPLNQS